MLVVTVPAREKILVIQQFEVAGRLVIGKGLNLDHLLVLQIDRVVAIVFGQVVPVCVLPQAGTRIFS